MTAVLVLVVPATLVAAAWLGPRRLIYFPDRETPPHDPRLEDVTLDTSDGLTLRASLMRPGNNDRRTAVLVLHGNAGQRGDRAPLGAALAAEGFTVLLVDYRGYGGNPGTPTEDGLNRDARAALAHLESAGFTPDRVIYFGESLGAAVATRLATEVTPAALVLRSPFTELADAARHHYPFLPVRALLRDRFPVAEPLAAVTAPSTVIVGSADMIVPAELSRRVAEHADRLVEIPGAGHNDEVLAWGPEVIAAVVDAAGQTG